VAFFAEAPGVSRMKVLAHPVQVMGFAHAMDWGSDRKPLIFFSFSTSSLLL
jgi:hypothetical protein